MNGNKESEIFVDILGYEGVYMVSNIGRVKSLPKSNNDSERILKTYVNSFGYNPVALCINSICKKYKIHRLVAAAFIPNPENKKYVNHINGIKTDNRVENLEWCTSAENNIHALNTELRKMPSGKNHWKNKYI